MPAARRDRRLRARVLAGFTAFGLFWGVWGALVPAVQDSARVGNGELGTALLGIGAGALVSMRLTGAAIDRAGSRVLPVALLVFAAIGVLPALARGPLALGAAL